MTKESTTYHERQAGDIDDLTKRLRSTGSVLFKELLEEAATEIERLRRASNVEQKPAPTIKRRRR